MTSRSSTPPRFTRLKLQNWKNFRLAEVRLGPRAFFVGPNAAGKSNLLDSFRFLRDLVMPTGGLATAVEERGGLSTLRCVEARNPGYVGVTVDIGTDDHLTQWTYELFFNNRKKGRNEKLPFVHSERIIKNGETVEEQARGEDDSGLAFSQTLIQRADIQAKYEDLYGFLASIRYSHVVPQIVRERERQRKVGEDPFGGDLLTRIGETPPRTRDARLKRISEALRIAVPQFKNLTFQRDSASGRPHLMVDFEHWRENPTRQNEEKFSDGTLRFLGLLWTLAEPGGPVLLEEPELSLHDAIVSELPTMMERSRARTGRQLIATTHSASLISNPGIGLLEVHRLVAERDGTKIITANDDQETRALVEGGWPVGHAMLELAKPRGLELISSIDVAS